MSEATEPKMNHPLQARMDIINHIEKFLGDPEQVCEPPSDRDTYVFQCPNVPDAGVVTWVTCHAEDHIQKLPSGDPLRREYLVAGSEETLPGSLVPIFGELAWLLQQQEGAAFYGRVIDFDTAPFPTSDKRHFYAAPPAMFPQGFEVSQESEVPTIFIWLLPITEDEAAFVAEKGFEQFEDKLSQIEGELFDWSRESCLRGE